MINLEAELRQLAALLLEASASIGRIAEAVAHKPPLADPASAPPDDEQPPEPAEKAEVPWGALVQMAVALLREQPTRTWKPGELVREARDAGVTMASIKGVHFGMMARLRKAGAIIDAEDGFCCAPEGAAGPALEEDPAPAAAPASAPAEEKQELPWEALVEKAVGLLRGEPTRSWKPAELVRAVRDQGVELASLQGVHFGLMARLRKRGAIVDAEDGFSCAPEDTAPPEDPAPEPSAPGRPKREFPWGQLVPRAIELLTGQPQRWWTQSELCRAVVESGIELESKQGMHLGLVPRLRGSNAIEEDAEGKLRFLAAGLPAGPSIGPAETFDEVAALTEEIDECEFLLDNQPEEQRHAQVSLWAGRGRAIQEAWAEDPSIPAAKAAALHRVFGRLTRIAREKPMGWINALSREWTVEWDAHQTFYGAVLSGELDQLDEATTTSVWRAMVRGLSLPARRVAAPEAAEVLREAAAALPPNEPELRAAMHRFGFALPVAPLIRRRESIPARSTPTPIQQPPAVAVSARVLERTRGRAALILGGQGAREESRRRIQAALELSVLDWVYSERGAAGHYDRVAERIRGGSYDFVLFLAGYTGHKSQPALRECKASGVPLVYLPRGYSVGSVVNAIEGQLAAKAAANQGA